MKKQLFLQTRLAAAAVLAVTALGLTACGSKSTASYMAETTAAGAYDMNAPQAPGMSAKNEMAAQGSGLSDTSGTTTVLPSSRKLIRDASLTVETDQFDELLTTLTGQITALGGYTQDSSITGSSITDNNERRHRFASITARIPQDKLDTFISTVEHNGNITNRYESTTDITLQYSDLESRKKSLTMEQDRIWALLEKADSLESVIALEERLSEIRYELESMESQLRLYDNQVDYSTVTLSISEVAVYTPTTPESFGQRIQSGFSKNLSAMGNFLTSFAIWLIAASPIWVPIALIVIIIALITRRRHAKATLKKAAQNTAPDFSIKTEEPSKHEEP